MGQSTVVSTLPMQLSEDKYGLVPFRYVVPPAPKGNISTLTVGDGFHLILIPLSDSPPMRVVDLSEKIAEGLCQDYIASSLAVSFDSIQDNGGYSAPGLFWVEGAFDAKGIASKHANKVDQAFKNTAAWFRSLVKIADDDWARWHMHRTITDLQRIACNYLELEREWNFTVHNNVISLCWACKAAVNPTAIICGGCKAVLNVAEFEKNKSRFVNSVA